MFDKMPTYNVQNPCPDPSKNLRLRFQTSHDIHISVHMDKIWFLTKGTNKGHSLQYLKYEKGARNRLDYIYLHLHFLPNYTM